MQPADGLGQLIGGDVFQGMRGRAGLERSLDQLGIAEADQRQDFDLRPALADQAGGGHAIHHRHLQVHQDDIRLEQLAELDGLFAIAGFTYQAEFLISSEERPQTAAHQRQIIGSHQSD